MWHAKPAPQCPCLRDHQTLTGNAAEQQRAQWAVCAIIGSRFVLAGLFAFAYGRQPLGWSLAIVALATASDMLDGMLGRRCSVSAMGGYLDAMADMCFVSVAFVLFSREGLYPWWVPALIGAMFVQFVVTSGLREPTYDPVGKYYGVFLFAAVGLTLLWPAMGIRWVMMGLLVAFTGATLVSRIRHLSQRRLPSSDAFSSPATTGRPR